MKNDIVMYEKVYTILKDKIESGRLPLSSRLPSRSAMCREFNTSEKTVRRAVEMLAEKGYIETSQRKTPTVIYDPVSQPKHWSLALRKADAIAANDILKTGIYLCYPVISHGVYLCTASDWEIPESILKKMDPNKPAVFWQLSNKFWRFFVCRTENDLILRAVDSLGLDDLKPLPGSLAIRTEYYNTLQEFLRTVKNGGRTESVPFADLSDLYNFTPDKQHNTSICRVLPDSPLRIGTKGLEKQISKAEERYSMVYLDLLGLIVIGKYKPGDRLPTHEQLCKIYGVSVDTTIKAIQFLQSWGVVTATRSKGIFVSTDFEGLQKIQFDLDLITGHVRRFLDSLELLSLIVEGAAAHAAAYTTSEEVKTFYENMEKYWDEKYLYLFSPTLMLHFIGEHIQYDALRGIFNILQKNYLIGRCIPKLTVSEKTPLNCQIHRECMDAAECLIKGDKSGFAQTAAGMFRHAEKLVISACRALGYLQPAMEVYDGSLLWK